MARISSPRVAVSNLLKFLASPSNHQRGAAERCLLIHPFGREADIAEAQDHVR